MRMNFPFLSFLVEQRESEVLPSWGETPSWEHSPLPVKLQPGRRGKGKERETLICRREVAGPDRVVVELEALCPGPRLRGTEAAPVWLQKPTPLGGTHISLVPSWPADPGFQPLTKTQLSSARGQCIFLWESRGGGQGCELTDR